MRRRRGLTFLQVDAFTDVPFGGNPAVVVLNADHVSDEIIQLLPKELGVGQTVFVSESTVADARFRFMAPGGEMPFSGSLTVAALHVMAEEGIIETSGDVTSVSVETKAGVLSVEVVKNEETNRPEIQITVRKPEFLATYDPRDYAEALGLSLADIMSSSPIQTVSTGTPQLMIPVSTLKALDRIRPDWSRLGELGRNADYVSIQVFTRQSIEPTSDVHVRHFAPSLGINEDPVTGSAAGGMGSYIIRYGLMEPTYPVTSIVVEQGHSMGRPGKVFVEVRGDPENIQQVKVSGTAVTILKGTIYI
jgi:trans-2,3-dihydro-3-hydroxyanthranilate isomerase